MHIKKNSLFTIQPKGLEIPEVSGMFSDTEHLPKANNKYRLTIYRDNVPIVILETVFGELKKYLNDRFNFAVYSLTE